MSGIGEWLEAAAEDRVRGARVRRDDVSRNAESCRGLLDLASNDYLGLAGDPRLREAAIEATRHFGTGARSSASKMPRSRCGQT
jgi:8-amino-7-oxononanoate synthase